MTEEIDLRNEIADELLAGWTEQSRDIALANADRILAILRNAEALRKPWDTTGAAKLTGHSISTNTRRDLAL